MEDTGIGLDEDGIRGVLATIGASTKRDALGLARESFLGQFGIGLLSCFLVTDEIRVTTRRAGQRRHLAVGGPRRRHVRRVSRARAARRARHRRRHPPSRQCVRPAVRRRRRAAGHVVRGPPADRPRHRDRGRSGRRLRAPLPVGGRRAARAVPPAPGARERVLGSPPLDVVDLSDPAAGVRGLAFVLPHSSAARGAHRLYAKRMLVGDSVPDVLPDWAFFVRAVLDAERLGLTASREALHDDELLDETRARLGDQLKRWLLRMARTDRPRAEDFFRVHHLAAKAAATTDDDMLDVVAELLPWETTLGTMTLAEFSAVDRVVTYVDRSRTSSRSPPSPAPRTSRSSTPATPTTARSSSAGCSARRSWTPAGSSPSTSPTASPTPIPTTRRCSRRCSTSPARCSGGPAPCPSCAPSAPTTLHAVLLVGRDAHRERDRSEVAAAVGRVGRRPRDARRAGCRAAVRPQRREPGGAAARRRRRRRPPAGGGRGAVRPRPPRRAASADPVRQRARGPRAAGPHRPGHRGRSS